MSCCLDTGKTFVVKDENILRDTNAGSSQGLPLVRANKILISKIRQTEICIQP